MYTPAMSRCQQRVEYPLDRPRAQTMNLHYDLLIRNATIIDGARPGRLLRAGAAAERATRA